MVEWCLHLFNPLLGHSKQGLVIWMDRHHPIRDQPLIGVHPCQPTVLCDRMVDAGVFCLEKIGGAICLAG